MNRILAYLSPAAVLTRARAVPPRSALRPLPLFLFAAMLQLFAFLPSRMTMHWEINAFVAGVVEARNAMLEGQFPVRVTPNQNGGTRYPMFQFYANLPYAVSALPTLIPGVGPYTGWKAMMLAALLCGGIYTFRTTLLLTGHPTAAAWAGAVFLTAPYLFTDIRGRGAVSEAVAFNLVPAAIYYTLRCLRSRKWRLVPPCAIAWSAVALSHNITYLYGVVFAALLVLSYLRPRRQFALRIARLLLAGVLHAALVLWYFLPQTLVMRDLEITATLGESPAWSARLATLPMLLWPVQRTPDESTTPRLGLQIGWPILLAVIAAVPLLLASARRNPHRAAILRLLALFSLALFLVRSPIDVWPHLPKEFHYIQFTYRLLVFVVVFGALLTGCVFAAAFPRGIPPWASAAIGILLLASSATYVARLPRLGRGYERRMVSKPEMGGRTDYLLSTALTARTGWTHPNSNLAGFEFGLANEDGQVKESATAWLPATPGGNALALAGTVLPPPAGGGSIQVTFAVDGQTAEGIFPPGPFSLGVPVAPGQRPAVEASVAVSVQGESKVGVDGPVRADLTALHWEGAAPADRPLVPPDQVKPLMRLGRVSHCTISLARPSLVVLPVLNYPKLLSVRVNGSEAAHGNVGRFVALEVPAGKHGIEVRFVGVRWANAAGSTGLAVVVLWTASSGWTGLRRKLRRRGG